MPSKNSTNVRSLPRRLDLFATQPLHRGLRRLGRWLPGLTAAVAAKLFFLAPPRRRLTSAERKGLSTGRRMVLPTRWGRMVAWGWEPEGRPTTAAPPTVLLVHGWAGGAAQLLALVEPLRAQGLRVVLLDFPGHGASPGWRGSLPRWAEVMADVQLQLTGAQPLAGVVGHSLGALATSLAVARGLPVERVVLISSPVGPQGYFRAWVGPIAGDEARLRRVERATEAWLGAPFAEFDGVELARRQSLPALVIHDREDRQTSFDGSEAIAAAWPAAQLLATRGLGHVRLLEDPGVVSSAAAFLASGSRRCAAAGCMRPPRYGDLCANCALERELANPETRRVRAS